MEDFFEDIIEKAQRGLGLSDAELSEKSGVQVEGIKNAKSGRFNESEALKLAGALNLDGPSLVASGKKSWSPKTQEIQGLKQFETSFGGMRVNAYLIWDENNEALVFDTGADASKILEFIDKEGLTLRAIFLTHTHSDHIADLDSLRKKNPKAEVYVHRNESLPQTNLIKDGDVFEYEGLKVEVRKTSGHSPGGTTFVISGLQVPVAIVGDALFSGSMGRAVGHYEEALENNRKKIFTLPDNTIVCPGHGPMTTIEEEKAHNPFYPEFKISD